MSRVTRFLSSWGMALLAACGGTAINGDTEGGRDPADASADVGQVQADGSVDSSTTDVALDTAEDVGVDATLDSAPIADATNCETWNGSTSGDPQYLPLVCGSGAYGLWAGATDDGESVDTQFSWCGWGGSCGNYLCVSYGTFSDLSLEVASPWASVVSTSLDCYFQAKLAPNPGEVEGKVVLSGSITGRDGCWLETSCPVQFVYRVWQNSFGEWMIDPTPSNE